MHESLKNCPFCGAAAHFEMDEGRWEWVECESCGMQGNRSASLMEDCKPKLAEAWNRRTPQPVAREPLSAEQYNILVEDLSEWSRHVEVDTAPRSLEEHIHQVFAIHGIKGGQHGTD